MSAVMLLMNYNKCFFKCYSNSQSNIQNHVIISLPQIVFRFQTQIGKEKALNINLYLSAASY